jgi:hypothetical protein
MVPKTFQRNILFQHAYYGQKKDEVEAFQFVGGALDELALFRQPVQFGTVEYVQNVLDSIRLRVPLLR